MSALKQIALKPDFGIEDFLKPDAKVLYENAFTTKHIGREIDFFLFEAKAVFLKAKDPEYFEYRFRHILQLAIFNAWANYKKGDIAKCVEIEVGWDDEKCVVSVTGSVESDLAEFIPDGKAVPKTDSSKRIYKMIEQMQKFSDGLMVRYSSRSSRMQIIAFLNKDVELSSILENTAVQIPDLVEISEMTLKPDSKLTSAIKPEALAAANIPEFIKDENATQAAVKSTENIPAIAPSDTVISGASTASEDWLTRVSSDKAEKDDAIKISGAQVEENKDIVKISSSPNDEKPELMAISGGADDSKNADLKLKTLSGESLDSASEEIVLQTSDLLSDDIKSQILAVCPSMSNAAFDEVFKQATATIRDNMMKAMEAALNRQKLQYESKAALYKDQITSMSDRIESLKASAREAGVLVTDLYTDKPPEDLVDQIKAVEMPEVDLDEDNDKFEELVETSEASLDSLEMPEKSKQWVKGLLDQFMKARGDLNQKVKQFEINERKQRFELKTAENLLNDKLKTSEADIYQKNFLLIKTKEALNNTLVTLEKFKALQAENDVEGLKTRLMVSEKLLAVAQGNSATSAKRAEEMQQKWLSEGNNRATLQKELLIKTKSVNDLQRRLDQVLKENSSGKADENTTRIIDNFKSQVKQLQEKLQKAQADAQRASLQNASDSRKAANSGAGDAELKHKFDHASKMVRSLKEENDKMKKKYEDLRFAETKYKVEISKLQAQLKQATKK